MTRHLCVIPARGGSKGLPRKNILPLDGVPVLTWTVMAARRSGLFGEHVYVVSEDEEIRTIARGAGARIDFREPDEMAGDTVSSTVPVLWLVDQLASAGETFDYIWNLQPTSPLRGPEDLRAAAEQLADNADARFLASTTAIDPHYFHWALKSCGQDTEAIELWFPDFLVERHLLPPVWRPNGAIKVGRPDALADHGSVFSPGLVGSTMPEHRAIHIRSDFDLRTCEFIVREYREEFTWLPR